MAVPATLSAKTAFIEAKVKGWEKLELPKLGPVIKALEDCGARAAGPHRQDFWKDATGGCG